MAFAPADFALLAIIVAAVGLLLSNRLAPDLVGLLVLLTLNFSGLVPADVALAGFSRPAVITLIGLFMIAEALERTGAVGWLADRLAHLGGTSELRLIAVFMLAGALLSLVMNNITAGAILLPAAVRVARRTAVPPSKILMPLGFGTLLGGMATLFTTANIILSGALVERGQRALTILDFLPTGGALVVTGIIYMLTLGRRLLPTRDSLVRAAAPTTDLANAYQLGERLWEVRVLPDSALIGQTLTSSGLSTRLGLTVVAIWRGPDALVPPPSDTVMQLDDLLVVLGRAERVTQLLPLGARIGRGAAADVPLAQNNVVLAEALVAPRAGIVGQTLRELRFRNRYGLTAAAIWRGGRSYRTDVGTMPLADGDALLVVGPAKQVIALAAEPGWVVPNVPPQAPPQRRSVTAAVIATLAVAASALGYVATPEAMLAGAVALVLTGCLTMSDAYRSIEWRVIFLIAGMIPLGTALATTGLAAQLGNLLVAQLLPFGALAFVGGIFLLTLVIVQLIGGQVTALIIGPLAVGAAVRAGVNPQAVAVAVSIACSAAFLTPLAHPVNLLMQTPGGYTTGDYLRVGGGLTLVCSLTLLLVMPLFWQL